jgi:transcriptional regulator with XRE-family HTH domain
MDKIHRCLYSPRMGLGENVKFLREARSLTYDAVGTAVGTDGQNIFMLEKRKSKVSKFAPKLAKFFGVDLAALTSLDLSVTDPSQYQLAELNLTIVDSNESGSLDAVTADEIIEVIALMQQSDKRGRANILDFARGAAKRGALRWIRRDADEL